jgi:hypothetical protein
MRFAVSWMSSSTSCYHSRPASPLNAWHLWLCFLREMVCRLTACAPQMLRWLDVSLIIHLDRESCVALISLYSSILEVILDDISIALPEFPPQFTNIPIARTRVDFIKPMNCFTSSMGRLLISMRSAPSGSDVANEKCSFPLIILRAQSEGLYGR